MNRKTPNTNELPMKNDVMGDYALLIDAENLSGDYSEEIVNKASEGRRLIIKRIYANWTNNENGKWKGVLGEYSIKPVQQFTYVSGKNTSDHALIIEAMDLLYMYPELQGFIIVSSDSDYAGLASRLKESGKTVIGIGTKNTLKVFISACTEFIYLDEPPKCSRKNVENAEDVYCHSKALTKEEVTGYIDQILATKADEMGRVITSTVNDELRNRFPEFSYHLFGFSTITRMLKSWDYKIEEHPASNNYVICKP